MKTLILYKTVHGASRQYAEWLHEEISYSVMASIDEYRTGLAAAYDTIIIVSRTYMGDIQARKFMIDNWNDLKVKNVYLLAVGLIFSNDAQKTFERIPAEIRRRIHYTKVPGRIRTNELSLPEKLVVKAMKGGDVDRVAKVNISPVLEFLKKFE